jgi:diguanylate cyclase (GGDEF)-like protein/PAS domain S-box-containing protein
MGVTETFDQQVAGAEAPDLVKVFVDLLSRHPEALVAAVGDDGLMTAMPSSVPLNGHRVAVARSVLDMVVAADKLSIITTWEASRLRGGASVMVHLHTDPHQPMLVTMVDARAEHGVHLAMIVPAGGPDGSIGPAPIHAMVAPRTARVRKNELAVITEIDTATSQILGWTAEQLVGRRSLDFIHPDDQERSISNWMEMLTAPGHDQRVRLRHLAADGSWVWMEFTNRNLLNTVEGCVFAEMLDVSEELAAQEALRASEQRLRRLAESLPLGVVQIESDRRITYANERLAAITGSPLADEIGEQFCNLVPADRSSFDSALDAVLHSGADQDLHIALRIAGKQQPVRHCTISMRSLTNAGGEVSGAIVCVSDVSDQVRLTTELERRATYDALTGCLNRQSIMNRLEARLADPGAGVAIVFVDLDGFKKVNDDLGHAAGDALLTAVGSLLRDVVRDGDMVGRVGGDEFLIVCSEVADVNEALLVAERIDAGLELGIPLRDQRLVLRASLGVAHTVDAATSSDRLVADADTRMYVAKRDRHQRAEGARSERPATLRTRASEESVVLRRAIESGQLEVHYQPIVSLPSTRIHGLEALVRWRRSGEIIPAVAFIGLAERSGLITQMGARVLDDVILAAAQTVSATPLQWFINMSPLELAMRSKVADLREALDRHQVDASSIVIEVTEHSDLAHSSEALRAIEQISQLGVGIALDDFGTGYSSLALLRSVPVDFLKFDRMFTADLGIDPVSSHLLVSCRDLAERMNITLIAEGVETDEQRGILTDLGVQLAQGYLFSVPQHIDQVRPQLL